MAKYLGSGAARRAGRGPYEGVGAMDRQYNPYVYAGYGADVSLPPGCAEVCNPADASTFEGEATCDANCVGWRTMFQAPPVTPVVAPCADTCNPNGINPWMGEVFCNQSCPDWRAAFGCPTGSVVDPGDPLRCIPAGSGPPAPPQPGPPKPPRPGPPVVPPPTVEPQKLGILGWSAIGAGLLLLAAVAKSAKTKGPATMHKNRRTKRSRKGRSRSR